jgi:hypothetical protein
MRRLFRSLSVVACCVAVVGCGNAASKRSAARGGVIVAPAGIAAQAQSDADALIDAIQPPRGSVRTGVLPPHVLSALAQPAATQPYVTFRVQTRYWSVPANAVGRLIAAAGAGRVLSWQSNIGLGAPAGDGWTLPNLGRWIGPRFLSVLAVPDPSDTSRSFVEAEAVVVWTPRFLDLPRTASAMTIGTYLDGGNVRPRHVWRTGSASRIARIAALIDALPVDNAVNAHYGCPFIPAGGPKGLILTFENAAGRPVATATTEFCPNDLVVSLPGSGHQLRALGSFVAQLDRITGLRLVAGR